MDLKRLFKQLDIIKSRRDYELRVNGKSKQYKNLTKQYYSCLWQIGLVTERK